MSPQQVGYHWHPAFSLEQIPSAIDKEIQRGRMGVVFYEKHPTFAVKMMIQMTLLHRILWGSPITRRQAERKNPKTLVAVADRSQLAPVSRTGSANFPQLV